MKSNPFVKAFKLLNDKTLKLPQDFVDSYRDKDVPFGPLGYVVYKRSYARGNEEWVDTIQRCIDGAQAIGADYTLDEMKRLFDYIFNLKCSFGGRCLWMLGTQVIEKFGCNALINCYTTTITNIEDFCFIATNLMLGGGVGFSIEAENIFEFPRIKSDVYIERQDTKDADFIVPDSREGWIELIRKTFEAFFYTGKSFTYSTMLIRSQGVPLQTFGGYASGPEYLVQGIDKMSHVLRERSGKKIRPIDALDVANIIAELVVSGAGRRSSQIALGDIDSYSFLRAKRWDLGNIPNHRCQSNNSVVCNDINNLVPEFWRGYTGNSEPYGLFNRKLSRKMGRLGEKANDNSVICVNPCAEITLADKETCNLSEIFLPRVESPEEMQDIARLLYKTQKAIAAGNYIHEETNKIVSANMRLGMGVTGYLDCPDRDKINKWLDKTYKFLCKLDVEYSKEKGCNTSIKLTTVKPSGTLSLLPGVSPGVHPSYGRYYIRRVRMLSHDPLVQLCREHGYDIEYEQKFDGSFDRNTSVISFPVQAPDCATLAEDMSAIDLLETLKTLQTVWSDNAVSATIYFQPEELDAIKEWLKENYNNSVKTVSFLLYSEHGFVQAPYEPIGEQQYDAMSGKIRPITYMDIGTPLQDLECAGGSCPIR